VQAYIVDRFPLKLPSDTEDLLITMALPALQTCLTENESSDRVYIEILQHTVKVLRRVVAVKMKGGDFPQESLNFALEILSLGTRWSTNNSFDLALVGSVSLLEVISSKDYGRKHLWDDSRWQEGMQWALSSAVSDNTAIPPRGPSPVSYHSLNSLKHFAGDSDFSQRIIDEGFYLPLLLLIVPSVDSKSESAISTMPISAADVLGSFVRGERTQLSSLSKLIPRPLLSCLKNDEDLGRFINMAGSDIQNPTTMWTADVRAELRNRAQEQIARRKEGTNEDEAKWLQNFEYAYLQKDFVIGGVYVRHLAFGIWEGGDLPDNTEFLDLMMEHLERERNVVSMTDVGNDTQEYEDKHVIFSEGMQEQRSQAAELEKYLLVLVASKECLKFAVSHGRIDLVKCFKLQTFLEIASMDQCAPKVWTELMYIFKELTHNSSNHDILLQSNLLRLAGIHLWDAVTDDKGDETTTMILTTLDMLLFISENISATVEVTNYFSSSGIFFPLLCLFCDVDLPSLRTGIVETEKITSRQRLFAACILGQLLLCSCGVSNRVSFLGDSAEPKDPFSESKKIRVMTTDVDDLMMLLEPGNHGAKPLVFQTLMFLMPLELLSTLAHNPARACNLYKETIYNPRLVWDDETRRRVYRTLTKEAIKLQAFVKNQVVQGLRSWALELEEPVFTRWILATLPDNDTKPLYRNSSEESYVPEMYLGGFFLDQFLRIPEYFFGTILEQRFLREVKKAIVLDLFAEDPDSLRRVLLALLLLFKGRPYLLSGKSYIDIFLAVNRLIVSTGAEARMLAQPAIILTHSVANHKDIIDCIASEDLVHILISFLDLDVPREAAGFAGTDPRLCSLMLLRRLLRLSPPTVEITSNVAFLQKLADTALDVDGSKEVSKAARECLCLMCHDKRKGKEIIRLLDSLVPVDSVGFWDIPVDSIWDDIAGFEVLHHFLQHRYPCSWWNSDKTKEPRDEVTSTTSSLNSSAAANGVDEHHEGQEIFKNTASGKWDGQLSQEHSS
jgi:DnaJ family protein C protein 13